MLYIPIVNLAGTTRCIEFGIKNPRSFLESQIYIFPYICSAENSSKYIKFCIMRALSVGSNY